jgi:hypothetical protein
MVLFQPGLVLFEVMGMPFRDHLEDGLVRGERHVLLQARDTEAGLTPDHAGVGRQVPAEDFEQRRLPGAIPADHRHPLPGFDLQRNLIQ